MFCLFVGCLFVFSVCFIISLILGCQDPDPPANGYWDCNTGICELVCNDGYGIRGGGTTTITCGDNGWLPQLSQVAVCRRK